MMGRGTQKTGGKYRRQKNRNPVRKTKQRKERTKLLIICEGETERNYFDAIRREDDVAEKFTIRTKKGPGPTPEQIIGKGVNTIEQHEKQEKRYGNQDKKFDEVWCVFDVEGQEKRESLNKAVQRAQEKGIKTCLSNPCFEVWLLAHFVRSKKAYHHCDAVIVDLNKKWKKHTTQTYQKGDKQIYERVSGLTHTAIDNARKVRETDHKGKENTADCNSSSEVYWLVGKLVGEMVKGRFKV